MSAQPWMKFYPRDWRGDQALRLVPLAARGLWMEMLCIMHEASPYGHLLVGGQPVGDAALARLVGTRVEEVQALLVELGAAGVFRRTRGGVIYSKRMTDDHKRSVTGRKFKESALREASEKQEENSLPSRSPPRTPSTQKPEARVQKEGSVSAPKGSDTGGEPPDVPFDRNAEAWREAVALLSPGDGRQGEARKLFGRILKIAGCPAGDLLVVIYEAQANGTQDPAAYLTAAAKRMAVRRRPGQPLPIRQQAHWC